MDLKNICLQVNELVKQTGDFIAREAALFDKNKIEIKGLNDLVSYVDKEAEKMLVSGLRGILPEAAFITEEGTEGKFSFGEKLDEELYWIIDPVDGTTNFIHGLPIYAVSVGLMQNGIMVLGVVYEINKQECFYAWANGGAFCNGNPIGVSDSQQLSDSLLATGFPYFDFDKIQNYLAIIDDFMRKSHGLRRMGSAAVDLAYVACGRFEGFFEYNLKPWDVAGGALIVQEAGGIVTDFNSGNNHIFGSQIIAACAIHPEMQALIAKHWQ